MLSKLREHFKSEKEKSVPQDVTCANCKTNFDGRFCPNCGQSLKEYDKPFSFVFYNFLGDFFAFDTRFFRTIVTLLFKPGKLSKEYIEGRRVSYAPPFRIFVFVSFVLFLLLQTYTNRGLTTVLDSEMSDSLVGKDSTALISVDSIITLGYAEMDSVEIAEADSLLKNIGIDKDSLADEDYKFNANLASFRDTRDLRTVLAKVAVQLEEKLENEEDAEKRLQLREHIRLCRSPEQAMAKILEYISWAFFLMLPIFALILKLIYIRRKRNYMRHLIFSIHIHAFIYVVMIVNVSMYMIFSGNIEAITAMLMLAVPVYFIIAMKKFYGQSVGKVFLKFMVASFFYNIIFIVVVLSAVLNALNLF